MSAREHQQDTRVAVVTGGYQGIGGDITAALRQAQFHVIAADIQYGETRDVVKGVWGLDVTSLTDCMDLVEAVMQEFGRLDAWVNTAGIFPRSSVLDTTDELWDRVIDTNLKGTFHGVQAPARAMMEGGGQGSIVNIGSVHSHVGAPEVFAYAVAKGGILTLTRNAARSLAPYNIRVNCVNPGWVATPGEVGLRDREGRSPTWLQDEGRKLPLGRLQTGSEIAAAVVFLVSDAASQITGQVIAVDGGLGLGSGLQ